jgi:hypothetical protein
MANQYDEFVSAGFEWFIGVVEDRSDPDMIGRVRVRCFGYHTEDRAQIPTRDLPWATVMLPTTSAGVSGIGGNTGLVEGSWVFGFFRDGRSAQDPVIMGSIPGKPMEAANTREGFNDPNGTYPKFIGESDISQLAKPNWQDHENTVNKVANRTTNIPTAIPPRVTSVAPDASDDYYERQSWEEIPPRADGDSFYPFNHVTEYESGHVTEYDDTPGNERVHHAHASGTYYEITASGQKVEKIVGDNFTIIMQDNSIYIKGNCNVTVDGDMRHLVKGNYHLEVQGDYTQRIGGSRQSKIMMNDELEVIKNRAVNILDNDILTVHKNRTSTVKIDEKHTVTGQRTLAVDKDHKITVNGDQATTVLGDLSQTNIGKLNITSDQNITIETPSSIITNVDTNYTETIGGNQTTQITGNLDVDAARIDLN